ncbi:MAG: hypothetical protein ACR2FS_13450 [Phormidesmis sp.]
MPSTYRTLKMIRHATATKAAELIWSEIIPGHHQADYLGMCLEVELAFNDRWTVFDVNGDVWLEGRCRGLADGRVKAFNALKAEIQ